MTHSINTYDSSRYVNKYYIDTSPSKYECKGFYEKESFIRNPEETSNTSSRYNAFPIAPDHSSEDMLKYAQDYAQTQDNDELFKDIERILNNDQYKSAPKTFVRNLDWDIWDESISCNLKNKPMILEFFLSHIHYWV